jgi:serine protease Do
MSADGYIITNAHVVEGAIEVIVVFEDQSDYTATVIGEDRHSDLAVLKIAKNGLKVAEFGDSNKLLVGEQAVAIGHPLGFQLYSSMTSGIISAVGRTIYVGDRTMKLIQTDAAINSGNSGGPLINSYGQVIGINSIKMVQTATQTSVEGLGFAIPISDAQPIINELIEYGYVKSRPSIGIMCHTIDATTAKINNIPQGVYVDKVTDGGSAALAGVKIGDVIIGIGTQATLTIEMFTEIRNQYKPGDEIELVIVRNGADIKLKLVLQETLPQQ